MAIILPESRPAIDVVQDGYTRPEPPWEHLGDPEIREVLQSALPSVGRLELLNHPTYTFVATAFVVGRDLLLTEAAASQLFAGETAPDGEPIRAAVDFGRESVPRESIWAEIEEVVRVDPDRGVALLRADLPDALRPLRLSVTPAAELADREVALVGYPAFDRRNEEDLMNGIFRGSSEVKRILPGRVIGAGDYPTDRESLVHDCTSTGGCGGSPLIDLENGEVLGVHFAGRYRHENYAIPAELLARDRDLAEAGVQFAGPLPAAAALPEGEPSVAARIQDAESVGAPAPAPEDSAALFEEAAEAIVLAAERPAFPVEGGRAGWDGPWADVLDPYRARVDLTVRATGRVRVEGADVDWVGTAFLVGDRVALTASYAVAAFAEGSGERVSMTAGRSASIDFSDGLGLPPGSATAAVVGARFRHPYFPVALLELDRMPVGVGVLDLASRMPSRLPGRPLVVVSFAAPDTQRSEDWQQQVYGGAWNRLFVQPGRAIQLGETPGLGTPALVHDCATIGGSGGAPVLDLDTGYVVGVHTHGSWEQGGLAQPSWELARDPRVWAHPIRFRPEPRPQWLERWETEKGELPESSPEPEPGPAPDHWTVDDIPIDWARPEPKELHDLLTRSIQGEMAVYLAEDAGLIPGTVSAGGGDRLVWRRLLKEAGNQGLLRRLIRSISDDPQYAGLAPKLTRFL